MSIGANIRNIRESRGIQQAELAQKVGISQSMVCQIERGTKVPTLALSLELASALSCDVHDFIKGIA